MYWLGAACAFRVAVIASMDFALIGGFFVVDGDKECRSTLSYYLPRL